MKQAAKALIRDESGRILVLYRSETHPHLAHDVDLPGGEIERCETLEAGLAREIFEETGLEVQLERAQLCYSWRGFLGQEQFLYEVRQSVVQPISISWEHKSYTWMEPAALIGHSARDDFMRQVQGWLRGQRLDVDFI